MEFPWYSDAKNLPAMQETQVWSLSQEETLEKRMAIHNTILPGEFHGQRSLASPVHGVTRVGHRVEVLQIPKDDTIKVLHSVSFSSVAQSCRLFATPWTAACQACLSIVNSWSLLKLMSIESVIPSKHILCHPLLLLPSIMPSFRVFSNESSGGQSIEVSASTSVFPMNIQDWFPLGWSGWISLQSKGLSRVFSNITVQKHQFFNAQLSL